MSPNPGLDHQAFEAFLANAFAVQQSGLEPQSLSAVMEVQRFITTPKFKVDEALNLMVDRSLRVSNACGVAIARLEGHQLVYCSVSGSAGTEIGRRLPAVLSACTQGEGKAEILRVENAQTDARIQAEICRQFGAASLLILPIYDKHTVVGVLQVHFSEAHSFLDREVRAYRLMAGLAGEVISRTPQDIREQAPLILGPTHVPELNMPSGLVFTDNHNDSAQVAGVSSFLTRAFEAHVLARFDTAAVRHWIQEARRVFAGNIWPAETIGASILLCLALGIAHFHHPASSMIDSTPATSSNIPVTAPINPVPANDRKGYARGANDGLSPNAAFRRVRIGPNEVDYIAEDVTVKHFTNSQPRPQGNVKLVNIGDDVTVRYFTSESAVTSQTTPLSTTQTTK